MKLSVVVGTYNRLEQLKMCISSIFSETCNGVKVYITDAGSTDGTTEYLRTIASDKVIPIFVGRKIGQARAYNDVFSMVESPYVCWLSDDNVVVNKGLDTSVEILDQNPEIGMIGLKVKDMTGPFVKAPYIGGISSIGILNVNQGVLPTTLLKKLDGFSEEFRDYGIDPDLTARVLFSGFKVAYTRKVAIHHFRNWATESSPEEYRQLQEKHRKHIELYERKYSRYMGRETIKTSVVKKLKSSFMKPLGDILQKNINKSSLTRDWYNILNGRYISLFDPVLTYNKPYHLVQSQSTAERKIFKA